jgi:hypothetical protein
MLKTALITDRHYLDHLPGKGHPERPERVKVLIDMAQPGTDCAPRGHRRGNRTGARSALCGHGAGDCEPRLL